MYPYLHIYIYICELTAFFNAHVTFSLDSRFFSLKKSHIYMNLLPFILVMRANIYMSYMYPIYIYISYTYIYISYTYIYPIYIYISYTYVYPIYIYIYSIHSAPEGRWGGVVVAGRKGGGSRFEGLGAMKVTRLDILLRMRGGASVGTAVLRTTAGVVL